MLRSAVQVLAEGGYGEMSVARVTSGAGVSRRTFYDLFDDCEDCFLAAFDDAVSRARCLMAASCEGEQGWREQTRASLFALLVFLDQEPGVRSVLVVDALKAGPRVQQRRVEVVGELSEALHAGGSRAKPGREVPPLTGEGVIGAVLGVLHTRLLAKRPGSMVDLLGPLMGVIVLPYLGPAAAQRELARRAPEAPPLPVTVLGSSDAQPVNALAGVPMRVTHRTLVVLTVIGRQPGTSNRQVADHAGIADQGQISRLLARLEGLGLIGNTTKGQPSGEPNAWWLTPQGQQVQHEIQTQLATGALSPNGTRGSL